MTKERKISDASIFYIEEFGSRVVARTGIVSDRFHLGKLILQGFRDAPDFLAQIDGGTGDSETFASVLERSVACAKSMKNQGVMYGDAIVLMAPNHLDLCIPFYGALYIGASVAAIDRTFGVAELKHTFDVSRPKLVFCQSEKAPAVQLALNELDLETRIISFDGGDYLYSFQEFLKQGYDGSDVADFEADDFDPDETISLLISTSGSTGLPKMAAATHKNFVYSIPYIWARDETFPTPTKLSLIGSPLQWLTALLNFIMSPIMRFTRLQSSAEFTRDHAIDLIHTYRPTWTIFSPTFMTTVVKAENRGDCDLSSLKVVYLGGSAVTKDLIDEIKELYPDMEIYTAFGMSELTGLGFINDNPRIAWACGRPTGCMKPRLIDVTTGQDIYEPNVPGELWLKGPNIFKYYYNNPKATDETFAEGQWLKTGDMFYRDDNNNYFFVERIKMLLKYKSYQISPYEVEEVIRRHPAVMDAGVAGIPDPECGDLVTACVVRKQGCDVTAQEIKDFVKESLSDSKQLRGGVIFVDSIPVTSTTKVHRQKLKQMVLELDKE